jgi:hypothetical protein
MLGIFSSWRIDGSQEGLNSMMMMIGYCVQVITFFALTEVSISLYNYPLFPLVYEWTVQSVTCYRPLSVESPLLRGKPVAFQRSHHMS